MDSVWWFTTDRIKRPPTKSQLRFSKQTETRLRLEQTSPMNPM
ncbi:UNVERIFIED_CONTAM: hypothetical protein GTU68_050075 [Idotea baltica]|nr:hypothetical protein [Idotea baltica]